MAGGKSLRQNTRRKRVGLRPRMTQKLQWKKILIVSSCFLVVSVIFILFFNFSNVKTVRAGTSYTWNGSVSSDWNESLNWTPNGIPTTSDNVTFGNAPHACVLTTDLAITNLVLNSNSSIDLNHYNLALAGNFNCATGSHLELTGGNFSVLGNATINGGLLSDSDSLGLVSLSGATTQFGNSTGGPIIDASLNVNSSAITMRSTTFNRGVVIQKNGASGDYSYGANIFNGITEIVNAGSGNLVLSNTSEDIFNNVVTFSNIGTAAIYPAYNDASGTQFNDSVFVNSISGSGVLFGASTGNAILAADKKIKIGQTGFTAGTLSLRHFSQLSPCDQTLQLGAGSTLSLGPASTFEGNVLFEGGGLLLNGATFRRKCSLTKTGPGNNNGNGGNVFNDTTAITNSGSAYLLTANGQPDQFNAVTSVINNGSGDIYLAHSVAGTTFNGVVNLLNAGSGASSRIFVCEGNIASSAVFNDQLTVTNSASSANAMIRISLRGRTTLKSDLIVNNTMGAINSNGIFFGWNGYAGSTVMDSLHSVQVGPTGFANGTLSLINFTKSGVDSLILPFMNSSGLTLGPSTSFGGPVQATASSIYLNGCHFLSEVDFTKTGSTNESGTGSNYFEARANFTNTGNGTWIMENTNPDTFATAVNFNNLGGGSIQFAQGSAGNLFNGKVVLNNHGSGATNRILVNEGTATASSVFNDTVEVNNLSSATTAFVRFNLRGTSVFNNHLILNSTGGTGASNNGIYFGWQGYNGSATLAASKQIIIGSSGFNKGALSLIKFSKLGVERDSLIFGNAATFVLGPSSIWNSELFCASGGISLNGCTFSSRTEFLKTGSTSETSGGGNTFNGDAVITNSGSGSMIFGNSLPDVFRGEAIFSNGGTGYLQLANASAGNIFDGKVTLNNSGGGVDNRILLLEGSTAASATFNSDVIANNTSTATTAMIRFSLRGVCTLNGNLIVNNSSGPGTGNCGIYFGWPGYTGSTVQNSGKNISIGNAGYANGTLALIRFNQLGALGDSLTLSNNSTLTLGPASHFGGSLFSTSGSLLLNGCTFDSSAVLKKMGASNDVGAGGNVFHRNSTLTNSGGGYLLMGNSLPDIFNGDLEINNLGTSYFYLGYNAAGNEYKGNVILNNTGTGSDTRILIGEGNATSTNTFNGDVTVNNLPSSTDGLVRFNLRGTTSFLGNLILNNSVGTAANNGIDFGWPGFSGSARLANGKTISIGAGGFSKGTLLFQNFVQEGSEIQTINLTGSSSLVFGSNSVFNGSITASSPELFFNGTTFNGTLHAEKNSNNSNACSGNNTFNASSEFVNNGTNNWIFSNSTKDRFNGIVNIKNISSGSIYLAHNDASGTQFNDNIILENASTGSIRFGQGSGTGSLAIGKTITFGPTGFLNGSLYFRNFTQLGSSSQSLQLPAGTASVIFQSGTIFNGSLDVNVPQLFLNGSTFNGVTTLIKNGATNNTCIGGNTYNADVSIRTTGSGILYLANTTGDNYYSLANFRQNGIGQIYPAYNSVSNFRGNISTQGSDTVVTFAVAGGSVNINGSGLQFFYGDAGKNPRIRRMTMSNSAGLALSIPVSIYTSLTLSLGNIFTTSANILTIENGISSVSSVSDNSYVEGPMKKVGNQSFLFPIGKNSKYRPLGITPPGSTTDQYIAEYIHSDPGSSYNINSKDATLNNISQCEYWTLNKTGGASNPFVTLSWASTSCGINTISDLRVARWDAALAKWRDMGNASMTGNPSTGTVLASMNSSTYLVYTLGSVGTSNVLPIELSRFDAQLDNGIVKVEWETMSEINNDFFSVERSTDGVDYELIGKVKGAGNSTGRLTYNFNDENPLSGTSFYRLKQTDFDGKFEYFDPVSIKMKGIAADFKLESVGPNPFIDHITFEYRLASEKKLVFQLYTIGGGLVGQKENNSSSGTTRFEFTDVGDLPAGMYIIKIIAEGEELYSGKAVK